MSLTFAPFLSLAGEFMQNPWSVFDLIVVCASLVELVYIFLVSKISDASASSINIAVLRLLRVFRFGCHPSLNPHFPLRYAVLRETPVCAPREACTLTVSEWKDSMSAFTC